MASQGMLSAGNAYARTEGKASSNSYYYVGGGMGATFKNDGPEITYEAVDESLIAPRPRKYD